MADRSRDVYQTRGEALDPDEFRDRVRDVLRDYIADDSHSPFIRAYQISKRLDSPSQRLATHIPTLVEEGSLEIFRDSNRRLYRITIHEDAPADESDSESDADADSDAEQEGSA